MAETERSINVRLSDHVAPGLYLSLEDSAMIDFTQKNIEKVTTEYWENPEKIPPSVKEVIGFQRCTFCPLKKKKDFCDALRPILPLLEVVDNYRSFDEVVAVYKGEEKELCHLSFTTMQRALRYITTLSLMAYCQVGRKYWKYFAGIIPIMGVGEIINRVYLNMYWIHKGNKDSIDQVISKMNSEITITTRNQAERLLLICKNDAFINAFVLTHLITEELYEYKDANLMEQVESFGKNRKF
jgi:hypothetical protein